MTKELLSKPIPKMTNRARGGIARARVLSPVQLSEIGQRGAAVRWGTKPVKATHKGNFKEKFGVDVECYVLNDIEKTPVISQTGMARTLGLAARGQVFPRFIASRAMSTHVGTELQQKIENPVQFQWSDGSTGAPPLTLHGVDATLLIDICNAIIAAEAAGALRGTRYQRVIQQAHIIVGASAKSGIKGLVYALAGYNPSAAEVIAAFKLYVQEEARKYEPEFPNELYVQWHRLYDIPVPVRGKPWQFKHLTVKHIYFPLAKSNGKILELIRALKSKDGDRQKKLFQFLNMLGARALRMHIGRVLEMAEDSPDQMAYDKRILLRFGGQQELDLVMPDPSIASERPSERLPSAAPASGSALVPPHPAFQVAPQD